MSKKEINILFPLIVVAIAISGYLVCLKVLIPKVASDQAKVRAAESDVDMAQAKLDSIVIAKSSMAKIPDLVNNLLIAVPDSVDAPDLITEVAAIASSNQVAIKTLSPPVDKSLKAAPAATGSKTTVSASTSLEVTVSVQGPFPSINNFILGIETSIRFSKIKSLTISSSDEGSVTASIIFDVYKRPATVVSTGGTK